jgi:predicted pyridoxine 5'-phosphate oxidase superfamily flavin-nucleotide-binding protein
MGEALSMADIERCFGGAIPAVVCTVSAEGNPNVTYLTKAHRVDDERIALSNQFMSKTARNLADNPWASLLLIDPVTFNEYRLTITYERTDRKGRVFERLRQDVDDIASMVGMQEVFRLRAADVFRVIAIEPLNEVQYGAFLEQYDTPEMAAVAELTARLGRCRDLDMVVDTALDAIVELLGYRHVMLLLLDEAGHRLFTIASRGFGDTGIGAEVEIGEGVIGIAAERCAPLRMGNMLQMQKYSRSVRRAYEAGDQGSGREIPMPGLDRAESRLAVPAMALGELIGMLVVDRVEPAAFSPADEQVLSIVASTLASAIEHARALELDEEPIPVPRAEPPVEEPEEAATAVRYFAVDGSAFIDGDYLIKGVAGRIFWSLLSQHHRDGRVDFTNRELRLDPSLELPEFKDNLESRLVLLKRRLDERDAPVRIERTGRGRFRLDVRNTVRLEATAT